MVRVRVSRWVCAASLSLLCACGSASANAGIGRDRGVQPDSNPPVVLELRSHENVYVNVADYRGQVVLLFLFATFDGVSQAALRPLNRFIRHHPEVYVLGIAVQPDAKPFLDAWVHALSPPFVGTYAPNNEVSDGISHLGPIEAVPTFVFLDEEGRVSETHVGILSEGRLERLLARVQEK